MPSNKYPEFSLIVAYDTRFGIGKNGDLPWTALKNDTSLLLHDWVQKDMARFRRVTLDYEYMIMGWNTWVSLHERPLRNRCHIIFTKKQVVATQRNVVFVKNMAEFYAIVQQTKLKKACVIGGTQLYTLFMPFCQTAYITQFPCEFDADTFFPQSYFELYFKRDDDDTVVAPSDDATETTTTTTPATVSFQTWHRFQAPRDPAIAAIADTAKNPLWNEIQYLRHLDHIVRYGALRMDRTRTGTVSVFAPESLRFDLTGGIVPLLTTKKMAWKGILKELLWFLRGDTDAKILQRQGVHIWDKNTTRAFLDSRGLHYEEGVLGPGYGWMWRHFGAAYDQKYADSSRVPFSGGCDQIRHVEHLLQTDPTSRRIVVTAWDPTVLDAVALPPCHMTFQFYVSLPVTESQIPSEPSARAQQNDASTLSSTLKKELSCHVYLRSNDTFLGCPYNIFSYAALTCLLAKRAGFTPKELIVNVGDAHVYFNHLAVVGVQLQRAVLPPPQLVVSDAVIGKDYSEITVDDFELVAYQHWPPLPAVMSA